MPALILQHKRAPVTFDPPDKYHRLPTDAEAEQARLEMEAERSRLGFYEPPTEEQWRRLEAAEAIARVIDEQGAAWVMRTVRNLAGMKGQAI
jgi:hypothetical protein